ncbi:MAG: flippase-like domain-containing protein [Chitinophagales bacterium]|nr:flippase-like domain-containing protein [Chitinophagales bacterium]MDW8419517.1 lysylphosphatidylglycerol synthase transmembrane domain-containing protein [Chitinophagales bacterium]
MKKKIIQALKIAVSLGLGVGLIVWFVRQLSDEDLQTIRGAFMRADYLWIMLAPFIGTISNISRARRWIMLLEPTGHKPGFVNTFCSVIIMYFFNMLFPRLGEVTRCTILARYEKVPLDKSIGTMVVERVVDMFSLLAVGAILMIIESDRLLTFYRAKGWRDPSQTPQEGDTVNWIIYAGIILLVIAALFYMQRRYGLAKLKQMIKNRMVGFIEGVKSIRYVRNPWEFTFHSLFIWFCYYLMLQLSFPALDETAKLGVSPALACLFFGGFAMVATPGGIGAYPLAIAKVLALYGIMESVGYALGSLIWVAQVGVILLGGGICLIILALMNREPE